MASSSSWKLALGAGLAAIAVIGIMAYMSADHEAEVMCWNPS